MLNGGSFLQFTDADVCGRKGIFFSGIRLYFARFGRERIVDIMGKHLI